MDAPEPKPKERQRGIGPTCRGCGGPMFCGTTTRLPDGGSFGYYYCRSKLCGCRDSCKVIRPAIIIQQDEQRKPMQESGHGESNEDLHGRTTDGDSSGA